ncbi:SRPBCC family protein [Arthrobacter citreus]|uniref:SRPBCC family protein n=1 Tax=Arthrobacter citreus TaxID=1670 RepID=UPI0031F9E081
MGDQIRVAAQARCSPEQLWQALVDHRAAWWPEMDFTASPGAPLTERFSAHDDDGGGSGSDGGGSDSGRDDGSDSDGRNGPGTRATGTVLAVARERLLSFRWTMPGWNSHTIVSFTLDAGLGLMRKRITPTSS